MDAVILAAGLGSRAAEFCNDRPKGLFHMDELGTSLVCRSLEILRSYGIENVYIGAGHMSEFYMDIPGVIVRENPLYRTTSNAKTLGIFSGILKNDFLLLESDLLFERRAIEIMVCAKPDTILATPLTRAGDEVFLEVVDSRLVKASKDRNELASIDAELVGISKLSIDTYNRMDFLNVDYEHLLYGFSVHIEDDLVWCEIDCPFHLQRARDLIIPQILQKEKS